MPNDPLKVSDIFVPGKQPDLTYNPRSNLRLEERLDDYLDERGAILTVAGPTKTGKSILLRHKLKQPIWCDGQGIESVNALWGLVVDQLGAYSQREVSSNGGMSGGGHFGATTGVVNARAQWTGSDTIGTKASVERPLVSVVSEAITGTDRAIVIDDFHFIDRSIQQGIVRALKPLALNNVPVIFASISHRAQDVVEAEPDMTGRVVPLKIDFWSEEELLFIARSGFKALNVSDEGDRLARILAAESFGSPHMMQRFCLELCKANNVRREQSNPVPLHAPSTGWAHFFSERVETVPRTWFERLLRGPRERGQARTQYQLADAEGATLDRYGLILRAVAQSGPQLTLSRDDIRTGIGELVAGQGPAEGSVVQGLQHMSRIAAKRKDDQVPTEEELEADQEPSSDVQPVLEYTDDGFNPQLHIADPFFAFVLRWGSQNDLHSPVPAVE